MNWGYKILIAYSIFVGGIVYLMIRSSGENTDLVTPDYYAQELKYQQKIDEAKRASDLPEKISYELQADKIIVRFPKFFNGTKLNGTILLYCPADKTRDIKQSFVSEDLTAALNFPLTVKGLYELQISWEANGQQYYYEKKINI